MRLQHQTRRDGLVLVGSSRYELDEEGCVDVTEEHAELMLQGAKWRPFGEWGAQAAAVQEVTPQIVAGARRVRTREEMLGFAEATGTPVKKEEPKAPEPEPEPEEEEETIEVSMAMTRLELVEVAENLGLNPSNLTKAEIIELIEASQE